MSEAKRPSKSIRLAFLESQYAVLKAGIPGVTVESVKASIALGGHYLFESEVEDLTEKKKDDKNYDLPGFLSFLQQVDGIKVGGSTRTGTGKPIDGMERVLEVTNEGEDPEKVLALAKQLTAIRAKIQPLINKHAVLSIAFKNVEPAKTDNAVKTEADVTSM